MKHKVSELSGALLDAAVAKAEGRGYSREQHFDRDAVTLRDGTDFAPSTDGRLGITIIERERITLCGEGEFWDAYVAGKVAGNFGQTALIAAMRAYVASRFGKEVELP